MVQSVSWAHLSPEIAERGLRGRHVLSQVLQPGRGGEPVRYHERAEVEKLFRYHRGLLRRDDYTSRQVPLLSDDREERIGQTGGGTSIG
jgi:hypothetical protein